ncbi:transcriptional regulator, TetR family [Actinoalloteichus hymeniacidonis]|uniref:Transcriptional regulator, TetR family n=2 Tax=Actinoalloteichus hymeniacidonis TaxID=340345 RepID=A0AAC9MY19_9PSEU|nr:transcriptional regulator, TetR family [Actinoalloteichus hymeniacidonis]
MPPSKREGSAAIRPVRDRVLDVATVLFYRDGIRAVSADKLIAEVGISKVTFYRHFPTKDDLVVAYLQQRSDIEREGLTRIRRELADDPMAMLRAYTVALGEVSCAPGFRGCPFINAAAEFADPDHPVRVTVAEHRRWFSSEIREILAELGVTDVGSVAEQLILLRDGAMVSGYVGNPQDASKALTDALSAIIDAAR